MRLNIIFNLASSSIIQYGTKLNKSNYAEKYLDGFYNTIVAIENCIFFLPSCFTYFRLSQYHELQRNYKCCSIQAEIVV